MPGNAIAAGAVTLTASADGLASGLDKAGKDVQGWGTKTAGFLKGVFSAKGGTLGGLQEIGGAVTSKLAGLAGAAKGALTGAGTAIGTALGGPIGAAVGGAVGSAVGGIGETVVGAIGAPFERLDKLGKTQKQADVLGVSASELQGVSKLLEKAGIDGDRVGQVFAVMGRNITAGMDGSKLAAFQKIGVVPDDLKGMTLTDQFKLIADGINRLPKGAEQAAAAMGVFGKSGAELLPVLQRGGKGIDEFIDQQKKLGSILSDEQIKAGANASKAWKEAKNSISNAWDGLQNRAALIAAPIVQFAGNAVSKAFALATPVFEWLGRAVGRVADIATVVFEQLTEWFEQGVNWLKELGVQAFGFAGNWPTIEQVVVGAFKAIGVTGAYAFDTIRAGVGAVVAALGFMVEHALAPVVSAFKELVGLSKHLPDAIRPGWVDGMNSALAKADASVGGIGRKMTVWGKKAWDDWGTSADVFLNWLDTRLGRLGKKGADVAKVAPGGGIMAADWEPMKFAGAVEAGTKEAYSLSVRNRFGDMGPAENVHKENGKKLDKHADLLKQILGKVSGLEDLVEGI